VVTIANATLKYLSGGVVPVLNGSTPGMVPKVGNNTLGVEDGTIVVVGKTMHMFPTELSSGWTKTRVVRWTASVNDRLNWTFQGGITPHGHGKCGVDDHHAQLWSGSPQWQAPSAGEPDGRWYLSVVGYNQNCNETARSASGGDGRILLFKSSVAGEDGIVGPFAEVEAITKADGLLPRAGAAGQPWEDWGKPEGLACAHKTGGNDCPFPERIVENGICSFSPSYKSAIAGDPEDRIYAFYGSAWITGQCYSDHGVEGPWVRLKDPRPIGNWGDGGPENPLVFKSKSGVYMLIWAANLLQVDHGLAFAWSLDGVNWQNATGAGIHTGAAGYMLPVAPAPHVSVRTPLALVEHDDRPNFFTLFFTAYQNNHEDPAIPIGGYEDVYASEMELVLTKS
jgi:hypothetical protein